jgi:hypothetical protein
MATQLLKLHFQMLMATLDVQRDDLGGHSLATSGTAGTVVTYTAPSVGGMDLFVTYAPSSEELSMHNARHTQILLLLVQAVSW